MPMKKHTAFQLQTQNGKCCLGKQSVFIIRNTYTVKVKCRVFVMLRQVTHTITTVRKRVRESES